MKIISTRLCCLFSTLLLATSLFAQTAPKDKNASNATNVRSANYVPYDAYVGSSSNPEISYAGEYQRRSAPTDRKEEVKPVVKTMRTAICVSDTTSLITRVATVADMERKFVAPKVDTISTIFYSLIEEVKTAEDTNQNKTDKVASKTIPLSHFQQIGKSK